MPYLITTPGTPPDSAEGRCIAHLNELITAARPRSVLIVLGRAGRALQAAHAGEDRRVEFREPGEIDAAAGRWDLALLYLALGDLSRDRATRLVATLRDVHSRQLYVVVPDGGEAPLWNNADLFALGLRLHRTYPAGAAPGTGLRLFGFSLSDYKTTPEWLNSSYWANPELFDKYRW